MEIINKYLNNENYYGHLVYGSHIDEVTEIYNNTLLIPMKSLYHHHYVDYIKYFFETFTFKYDKNNTDTFNKDYSDNVPICFIIHKTDLSEINIPDFENECIESIELAIISPDLAKNIFLLFQEKTFNLIYTTLTICSVIHWIYCIKFWYKYDRYSKAIFPLIFPHYIYAPFYYYQVKIKKRTLKGKIIEKEPENSNEDLSITDIEFVELTRKNIFGVIDLWTSKKSQLDYQKNVPIAQVSSELFCQWEDLYFPDSDDFSQSFNIEELEILSEFDKVLNDTVVKTHQNLPEIEEFIETEEWKEMNKKAIEIKKELNTVGNN